MDIAAHSLVLQTRFTGFPSPKLGEHFALTESKVPNAAPANGLLVQILWMSADPYLRNRMDSYFQPGQVLSGYVSGKVLLSSHAKWKAGDFFGANLPFSTVQQVTNLSEFINLSQYVDSEQELSLGVGLFGMPGSTAYAGLDLHQVSAGDRVWINACTGAVGSLAGQIAKNVKKCQLVLGSAGSKDKCEQAKRSFGYDECFDYHEIKPKDALAKFAPEGLDFVFENVGGDHFEAGVSNLRPHGRVAVCGAISGYNTGGMANSLPMGLVIYKQLKIEGFLCGDWLHGKRGNFLPDMAQWYKQGLITKQETVFEGIEQWPKAFATLFEPGNSHVGKVVVKV